MKRRPISCKRRTSRVLSSVIGSGTGFSPGTFAFRSMTKLYTASRASAGFNTADIVKLDIGVIEDGWVGDTATTVPVGMVEERIDQLLRVTETALERAIRIAREGTRLGDICAEIEDEARRNRFSVVREFVGHGVGRKLHEEPQIPNYGKRGSGPKLKAGMTLAIEPMINSGIAAVRLLDDGWTVRTADGMPSAHFEHTVLITKDEPEILTWRAKTQLK